MLDDVIGYLADRPTAAEMAAILPAYAHGLAMRIDGADADVAADHAASMMRYPDDIDDEDAAERLDDLRDALTTAVIAAPIGVGSEVA